jgi:hypothetical protein
MLCHFDLVLGLDFQKQQSRPPAVIVDAGPKC